MIVFWFGKQINESLVTGDMFIVNLYTIASYIFLFLLPVFHEYRKKRYRLLLPLLIFIANTFLAGYAFWGFEMKGTHFFVENEFWTRFSLIYGGLLIIGISTIFSKSLVKFMPKYKK